MKKNNKITQQFQKDDNQNEAFQHDKQNDKNMTIYLFLHFQCMPAQDSSKIFQVMGFIFKI